MEFWHSYQFDPESTGKGYDGGVLEISVNGGAWQDAGSYIVSGGYTGVIARETGNPWPGARAGSPGPLR